MKRCKVALAGLCLAASGTAAIAGPAQPATRAFTATYQGQGSSGYCDTSYTISGYEPADSAQHPVFVYTVGTLETYTNASATAAVQGMAARGYVAATIDYPDQVFGYCPTLAARAQCIYDQTSTTSATTALCSRSSADCSKGIVVGGLSQGAVIATLAHDYDTRVAAAWGMGAGTDYSSPNYAYNLASCMAAGTHTLPNDRLRIANGVADIYLSTQPGGATVQAQAVTGLASGSCVSGDGTVSCYRSNGSGWHIVQNDEVPHPPAGHCYMRKTNACGGSEDQLDAGWQYGNSDWQLNPELDWLARFTTH